MIHRRVGPTLGGWRRTASTSGPAGCPSPASAPSRPPAPPCRAPTSSGTGPGCCTRPRSAGWPRRHRCAPAGGGGDGFLRTRLTHSLEVAQIGREMGAALGCDPDVVDTAGLAHDLGHPPFGHNGEDALDEVGAGVRRIRGQRADAARAHPAGGEGGRPDGASAGLNLTRAGLDATCKYPWPRRPRRSASSACTPTTSRSSTGCARGAPAAAGACLEAQVMDWADDVAYSVHDVEDGIHAGHVVPAPLLPTRTSGRRSARTRPRRTRPSRRTNSRAVLADLLAEPALAAVAGLRRHQRPWSPSSGPRASSPAVRPGRGRRDPGAYGDGPLRRYDADLVVPRARRGAVRAAQGHRRCGT